MTATPVVLDSWAVLAWLDGDDPAADAVDTVIDARPLMSWINLVEVAYRLERQHGRAQSESTITELRRLIDADLPGTGRMLAAARIKATTPIALGDCFALATAIAANAELWTGDPEILRLPNPGCPLRDLR
ncbi:MAG: PIN domain-containing protein [Patulibacter sp.]